MSRMIKIDEIDEFSDITLILDNVINKEIIKNVRNLHETKELEPFIQEIIHDPNGTPHGPTEISDIITYHVNMGGKNLNTAIVLKGKSFDKVKSSDVAHQFMKLRQIPGLDLIILAAEGVIQDDVIRDFHQTSLDMDANCLIIDAQDLARLLIAYGKICPIDGTPFKDNVCKKGHEKEESPMILMKVKENLKYEIINLKDVSNALAKRYKAHVIVDRHYTKELIRKIIPMANEKVKNDKFGKVADKFWKGSPAHVVNLYFAQDQMDIHHANWICRTSWVDSKLDEDHRPIVIDSDEKIGNINVYWESNYKSFRMVNESNCVTKSQYLDFCLPLLNEMIKLGNEMKDCFEDYKTDKITEEFFLKKVKNYSDKTDKLSFKWGTGVSAPLDCLDFENISSAIFVSVDEMARFCADRDKILWPSKSRDSMIEMYLDEFNRAKIELDIEKERLGVN
jgi:hypothetical protein